MRFFNKDKEEKLARRLCAGHPDAMQDFYTIYGSTLTAVCARYITDDDELKDVMQESMISLITHINQFQYRGPGSLQAWATRICINQALNTIKQNKRNELVRLDWDAADEMIEEDDPPINDIPPEVIQRFIQELPTGYRTVFNLYIFEEKSHEEIAQILNIKRSTSASQFFRAKAMLAKKIKNYLSTQQHRQ